MPGKWADSDRRAALPPNWEQIRQRIKKRAGGRCELIVDGQRCHRRGTECDHMGARTDHRDSMLQWLCWPHHREKTTKQGQEAKAAKAAQRYRPPEDHPGLIRR